MLKLMTYSIASNLCLEATYRQEANTGDRVWSFLGRTSHYLPDVQITPEAELDWMITLAQDLSTEMAELGRTLHR